MNAVLDSLVRHGGLLLGVTTAVLGVGLVAVLVARAPIHRQRLGEGAVLITLVWLALALVPLPRLAQVWQAATVEPSGDAVLGNETPAIEAALPPALERRAFDSLAQSGAPMAALEVAPEHDERQARDQPNAWTLAMLTSCGWVVVAVLALAYVVIGLLRLLWVLWTATAPPSWLADLAATLSRHHLALPPRIYVAARVRRPFCVGFWRGLIVIPSAWCRVDDAASLRHVLCHEIAHLRQRDGRGRVLFAAALPLLALHPFYWWLRHRTHFAAELLADDWAAAQAERGDYARHLVRLSARISASHLPVLGAVSVFSGPSDFYRRMTMLLARDSRLATRCSGVWRLVQGTIATLVTAAAVLVFGINDGRAQETKPAALPEESAAQVLKQRDALQADVIRLQALIEQYKLDLQKAAVLMFGINDGHAQENKPVALQDESAGQVLKQRDALSAVIQLQALIDQCKLDKLDAREAASGGDRVAPDAALAARIAAIMAAREAMTQGKSDEEVANLIKQLDAPDSGQRWEALDKLAKRGDARSYTPLIRALLHDQDTFVQFRAVSALGQLGDRSAVPDLVELLQDEDAIVREEALNTLTRLTGRQTARPQSSASPAEREKLFKDWQDYLARAGRDKSSAKTAKPDVHHPAAMDAAVRTTQDMPSNAALTAANTYILDLVTRAIDLRGDVEKGRVRIARAERGVKDGTQASDALELEKIELDKTTQKLDAVNRMIDIEREAANTAQGALSKQIAECRARNSDSADLEALLVLLRGRLKSLDLAR